MSTQSTLTVTGFVGSSVRYSPAREDAVAYASFRLGSTQRFFDRAAQAWRDGPTQWYTVKVWRQVATNVMQSLRKGDPVVVVGRLSTDEWAGPEGPRTSLVVEAAALGHDLVFGTTHFGRVTGQAAAPAGEGGAPGEGGPVDVSGLPEATVVAADPEDPDGLGERDGDSDEPDGYDDVEVGLGDEEDDLDGVDALGEPALAR